MSNMKHLRTWLLIVAFSCLAAYIVNPLSFSITNINWMLQGDLAQTLVGWEFYRVSPPQLPVTKISHLFPETGFSIIQSDSLPWVSVMMKKALGLLSVEEPVHFIGLWLVLCWILQGIYGVLFSDLLKLQPPSRFLLLFLFLFSPVLLFRFGHFSLMAHWMILAAMYEALRLLRQHPISTQRVLFLTFLTSFALGTHPYLFAIITPIVILIILLSAHSIWRKLLFFAGLGGLAFFSIQILGFSGVQKATTSDFGACNTDLLGLFNSHGSSLFVPALRAFWCQPEGFTYFGLGFLALLFYLRKNIVVFIKASWQAPRPRAFLILAALFILYSLASPIRFGGNPILYLPFYQWIEPLPSIFRASGRWIWPAYYTFLIVGVYFLDRMQLRFKNWIILSLMVFHFIEFSPLYRIRLEEDVAATEAIHKIQSLLPEPSPEAGKMHLFPRVVSVGCGIDDKKWDSRDWAILMIALARMGWAVDSGLGARIDPDLTSKCNDDNKKPFPQIFPVITKAVPPVAKTDAKTDTENPVELLPGIFLIEGLNKK